MGEEVIMAYFKTLSQNLIARTGKPHKIPRKESTEAGIFSWNLLSTKQECLDCNIWCVYLPSDSNNSQVTSSDSYLYEDTCGVVELTCFTKKT
jgi:hypothetical protein